MAKTPNRPTPPRMMSAAFSVGSLFLLTGILGFIRQSVFTNYFGTQTNEADAFSLVAPISDLIFNLIAGGALGSAFIPTFARYFVNDDHEEQERGWELFSTVITLVLIIISAVALLMAIFAPQFLTALYPQKVRGNIELLGHAVLILRMMLVSTVIFGASGVVMVALNSRHSFFAPALAAVIYNVGMMIGIILFHSTFGMGFGIILGAVGHLVVQLPSLKRVGGWYRPMISFNEDVSQILVLMLPRLAGLSFSYLNPVLVPYIAQSMVAGSITALFLGSRIIQMPLGVLGQSMGIVSFPMFASLAARGDHDGMRRILGDTVRMILFLGFPLTVGLMVLRYPFIALAFQRGAFGPKDTELVAWALLFYALALVALSLIELLARAFYAMKDTMTPVIVGGIQLVLMLVFGMSFGRILFPSLGYLPLGGVALGFALANWFETLTLLVLLSRKMNGVGARQWLPGIGRMGVASVAMALVMQGVLRWVPFSADWIGWILQLLVAGAIGTVVYFLVCVALRLEETTRLSGMVLGRLRR